MESKVNATFIAGKNAPERCESGECHHCEVGKVLN